MSFARRDRPPGVATGGRRSLGILPTVAGRPLPGYVFGPPLALLLGLAAAGLSFEGFLSGPNLSSLLERSAFVGIIVVGMTFLIIAGESTSR